MYEHDSSSAENRLMSSHGGERRPDRFECFYTAHYQEIAGYVRRRVAADEADDVIAQIFTVAWRRFGRIPSPPEDRLWLFGVARNSVIQHRRSERRRLRLAARLSAEAKTVAPQPGQRDRELEAVRVAIAALRRKDQEALQLVPWEELSHTQAVAVLGCSPNAFEIRFRRARNAVRAAVTATRPEPGNGGSRLIRPPTASRSEP